MEHIGKILGLCKGIYWVATEAKVNKKQCCRLAERVKGMEELVENIKHRGASQISPDVSRALWKLSMTLTSAHELVKKCARTKFVNQLKCKSEFSSVNEGLRDTYHILAGAVQVRHQSSLHRPYQDFVLDDDDDDWDATVSFRQSPTASPSSFPLAATPQFVAVAPRPTPPTAGYSAMVVTDGNTLLYAEEFFLTQ